ncbi:MAG: hypothetical protein AABX01_01110 [Candidatus Micrarchaeota archaeon]
MARAGKALEGLLFPSVLDHAIRGSGIFLERGLSDKAVRTQVWPELRRTYKLADRMHDLSRGQLAEALSPILSVALGPHDVTVERVAQVSAQVREILEKNTGAFPADNLSRLSNEIMGPRRERPSAEQMPFGRRWRAWRLSQNAKAVSGFFIERGFSRDDVRGAIWDQIDQLAKAASVFGAPKKDAEAVFLPIFAVPFSGGSTNVSHVERVAGLVKNVIKQTTPEVGLPVQTLRYLSDIVSNTRVENYDDIPKKIEAVAGLEKVAGTANAATVIGVHKITSPEDLKSLSRIVSLGMKNGISATASIGNFFSSLSETGSDFSKLAAVQSDLLRAGAPNTPYVTKMYLNHPEPSALLKKLPIASQNVESGNSNLEDELESDLFREMRRSQIAAHRYRGYWDRKPTPFNPFAVTAVVEKLTFPKTVADAVRFHADALKGKSAASFLGQAISELSPLLKLKAAKALAMKTIGIGLLKEVALDLQQKQDEGKDNRYLLHDVHELIAIEQDPIVRNELRSDEPQQVLAGLYQLYSDRMMHIKTETLSDSKRLKHLIAKHGKILIESGIESHLEPSFGMLESYYSQRASPEKIAADLQTEYQQLIDMAKEEGTRKVNALSSSEGKSAAIAETSAQLAELKREYGARIAEMKTYAGEGDVRKKLFQNLLDELRGANPITRKKQTEIEDLYKKTTSSSSGKQLNYIFDPTPSPEDITTRGTSKDCGQYSPDRFAIPEAHNLKVFLGPNWVGNVYLIEGRTQHGKTLHIDAIQTPINVDMEHFTKEFIEKLWERARGAGFTALTSNATPFYISNHPSVRDGFLKNYGNSEKVAISFPESVRNKRFESLSSSGHYLLKAA